MKHKLSVITAKGKQGDINKAEKVFEYNDKLSFLDRLNMLIELKSNDLFKKEMRDDIVTSSSIRSYSAVYTMKDGELVKDSEDKIASEFKQYSDGTFDFDSVINEGKKE